MKVGQVCKRDVTCVAGTADIVDAARLMREKHVGFLVVHEEGDPLWRPLGVLTDRDIVLQVTARDVDPHSVTAADVMTQQPMVARENDDLSEALQGMRLAGIRRVPVVDERGALTGVFAISDGIAVVAALMDDIAGSIASQQRQEWRLRGP